MPDVPGEVTRLLLELRYHHEDAAGKLIPLVYGELRKVAAAYMRKERPEHTLQPTALVHEAFLRLTADNKIQWQSRAHFYGVAARLMRQVLVDYARRHATAKRAGSVRVPLRDEFVNPQYRIEDILAVDEVIARLAQLDARQGQIVELRFFAGMNVEEIAEVLDISTPTVKREWASARAWLHREVTKSEYSDTGKMAKG